MLSEQCNMYKEMAEFLEEYVKERNYNLDSNERNTLLIAYKNSVSNERSAYRTTLAYEIKEKKKEESSYLPFIVEFKKYIRKKITKKCNSNLKIIERLIEKSINLFCFSNNLHFVEVHHIQHLLSS